MKIKELVQQAFYTAKEKGWHDVPATFGDRISLCHSELSEALEAYRSCNQEAYGPFEPIYRNNENGSLTRDRGRFTVAEPADRGRYTGPVEVEGWEPNKPEGVGAELADVVIRIFDMCGLYGIDLEERIREKMEYNKTRPYRHGGKVI